MDENEALEKWRAQIRKGFLELCILSLLSSKGEAYGLDLQESLAALGIEIAEGTLYPLLVRMTNEGSLGATWETPDKGHPRKYYRLTPSGDRLLAAMSREYEAGYASYLSMGSGRRSS